MRASESGRTVSQLRCQRDGTLPLEDRPSAQSSRCCRARGPRPWSAVRRLRRAERTVVGTSGEADRQGSAGAAIRPTNVLPRAGVDDGSRSSHRPIAIRKRTRRASPDASRNPPCCAAAAVRTTDRSLRRVRARAPPTQLFTVHLERAARVRSGEECQLVQASVAPLRASRGARGQALHGKLRGMLVATGIGPSKCRTRSRRAPQRHAGDPRVPPASSQPIAQALSQGGSGKSVKTIDSPSRPLALGTLPALPASPALWHTCPPRSSSDQSLALSGVPGQIQASAANHYWIHRPTQLRGVPDVHHRPRDGRRPFFLKDTGLRDAPSTGVLLEDETRSTKRLDRGATSTRPSSTAARWSRRRHRRRL
jgi:hypothetical protein